MRLTARHIRSGGLGLGLLAGLAGCGGEDPADREPARLQDRPALTPTAEAESLGRRVAARVRLAVGAVLPGGLRLEAVESGAEGVLYVMTVPEEQWDSFAFPEGAPLERLKGSRRNLAQLSCPLMLGLETSLLAAGGEIRFRYVGEDGRPSHELALREEDCVRALQERADADEPPSDRGPGSTSDLKPASPPDQQPTEGPAASDPAPAPAQAESAP